MPARNYQGMQVNCGGSFRLATRLDSKVPDSDRALGLPLDFGESAAPGRCCGDDMLPGMLIASVFSLSEASEASLERFSRESMDAARHGASQLANNVSSFRTASKRSRVLGVIVRFSLLLGVMLRKALPLGVMTP